MKQELVDYFPAGAVVHLRFADSQLEVTDRSTRSVVIPLACLAVERIEREGLFKNE